MIYPNSKRFFPIYKNNSGPQPGPDYSTPLTFTGKSGANAIQLTKVGSPYSINLQYNKNGTGWVDYTTGTIIEFN